MKTKQFLLVLISFLLLALQAFADIKLKTDVSTPLILKGQKQKVYLRVNLEGVQIENPDKSRTPLNLSVVLDKSGSMSGQKMDQAKEAARMIVRSLNKDDIFSFVLYDDAVQVLIPATKVTNKEQLIKQIDTVSPQGSTALFAGVSMGILETEKFRDSKYLSRIILLSVGIANVGPSSTAEISELGTAASKQGISITTIGIGQGYNEALMSNLAYKSDGSHGFAENPEQIATLLKSEMGQILNVAGKDIIIKVVCAEGVRPVKVIDYDANINLQEISIKHNQIYHDQKKFVLIELEVEESLLSNGLISKTTIAFKDGASSQSLIHQTTSTVKTTTEQSEFNKAINKEILARIFAVEAMEKNRYAIQLASEGKTKEANVVLSDNMQATIEIQKEINIPELEELNRNIQNLKESNGTESFNDESKKYNEYDNSSRSQNKIKKK